MLACSDAAGVNTVSVTSDQAAAIMYLARQTDAIAHSSGQVRFTVVCGDSVGAGQIVDTVTFVDNPRDPQDSSHIEDFQHCVFFGLTLNGTLAVSTVRDSAHSVTHAVGDLTVSGGVNGRCSVDYTATFTFDLTDRTATPALSWAGAVCAVDAGRAFANIPHVALSSDDAAAAYIDATIQSLLYKTAQRVLADEFLWLEEGVVKS